MIRCTIPLIAAFLSTVILHKSQPLRIWLSLIPVVCGAALITYGEISLTLYGFFITLLGCFLSALKTTMTKLFLSGEDKVPTFQLLVYVY